MKCPHCAITIHECWEDGVIASYQDPYGNNSQTWQWKQMHCPACHQIIIKIGLYVWRQIYKELGWVWVSNSDNEFTAYPRVERRGSIGDGVPADLISDYEEACAVLLISPKASAALSRRVLQSILRDKGYWSRDLSRQIDLVLKEPDPRKGLPTDLQKNVDAIRNFGNFSAHPLNDVTTLQVIDVEPEEAEWCLELVERLFDHYYVRPAADARRLAELNDKLIQAGKPVAKG